MLNLNHKNLDVYKKTIELVKHIYKITVHLPKEEMFGLTSQIRRAAISVPSNLAEGAARKSKVERKRFFEISRASLVELDTQIEIAIGLKMLDKNQIIDLEELMNHNFALISKLIAS